MKRIDMVTPIGLLIGVSILLFGIFSNSGWEAAMSFLHLPSAMIVLGGVGGALFVNFGWEHLKKLPRIIAICFSKSTLNTTHMVRRCVFFADVARREGLLSLEMRLDEDDDAFFRKGTLLTIDGVEPDVIKDMLNGEIIALEERHALNRALLEKAGAYGPAWGMIGTLLGLVLMLRDLNDPSTLGPSMAIALITTLYGTLLANLVCLPLAAKLEARTKDEVFHKLLAIEGIVGIQSGQNPALLMEKLNSFIPLNKQLTESKLHDRSSEGMFNETS
ncbi:MotA/TolQ/ExbB proton channel family protein [Aureibacillus halotolerans]|uniref:Chemotaxis protein MotA n=1 Tax=Aureibacillus halotolerans TaxID=1508390 RepID=A0A4R6U7Q7_9BACI|nr:MotA/TolQ/ExbB proton channel family protein [Aureibacillus halotolerans]TDQ39084.1 chemotaxis protein MotA [Aureibacillus halotolerans]